jgi:hypothetical protein
MDPGFSGEKTQHINIQCTFSTQVDVISGVPQGTVIGLLLFLTLINDLTEHIQSMARLFADDCLLFRKITKTTDAEQLQEGLTSL